MKEVLQLSRWREHVPFTVPLTVLGAIIASSNGAELDTKLVWVVLGNIATVSYAFMINDVEDAKDDARDPGKAKRNPVSSGRLSEEDAYTVVRVLAVIALFLYALTNTVTFGIGLVTLLLSHLYSWRRVRLKAYPVTDIVSHSLMLSGLLLLSGFSTFSLHFKEIRLLTAAAIMFSVYGQLYNQIRDYNADIKAGLLNTTLLIGKKRAEYLKNTSILLGAIAFVIAIYYKTFPVWLVFPIILASPVVFSLKTTTDTSGIAALGLSGKVQLQIHLIVNIAILVWLGQIFLSGIL